MSTIPTVARNAELGDLVEMLKRQHDLKFDAVVPATQLRSVDGVIHVSGLDVIDPEVEQRYVPTRIFDGQLADRLGVPVTYLRQLREGRPGKRDVEARSPRLDLFDANVNGWLHGGGDAHALGLFAADKINMEDAQRGGMIAGPDFRSFLFRSFREPGIDEPGIARALLSDKFSLGLDNLDVLMSVLDGVKASGVDTKIVGADLSESRMTVRIACPAIRALAPALLAPPTGGAYGETGGSAFTITPRLTVLQCLNGMKMTKDAFSKVHLGARLDEGIIRYSDETRRKNVELVTSQASDAVATFLDVDYVERKIDEMSGKAEKLVKDAAKVVEVVGKQLRYSETEQAGILDHFIQGGMLTAGGVMQAVTSFAQTLDDPDAAYELENSALAAMELAAA
jgi:hypothetical protein